MNHLADRIAVDLNVPIELVEMALDKAYLRFKKIRIPKKSGGFRTALQPTVELKLVQDWLMERCFKKLPVSAVATAFGDGASILKNATVHKDSLYAIRVDLKSFFPSVKFNDLIQVIRRNGQYFSSFVTAADFEYVLQRACFDAQSRLPIGYPSSPIIANVVMYDFDQELMRTIQNAPDVYGDACLTRYADDFLFSTNKKGACQSFLSCIAELIKSTASPRLSVNTEKTRFMSRLGGSMLITGLRINNQAQVRVHANYRDHVRLLLKLYADNKLGGEECASLRGHLAYIEHTDPMLFTKLCFKYSEEIYRLRSA